MSKLIIKYHFIFLLIIILHFSFCSPKYVEPDISNTNYGLLRGHFEKPARPYYFNFSNSYEYIKIKIDNKVCSPYKNNKIADIKLLAGKHCIHLAYICWGGREKLYDDKGTTICLDIKPGHNYIVKYKIDDLKIKYWIQDFDNGDIFE